VVVSAVVSSVSVLVSDSVLPTCVNVASAEVVSSVIVR